MVDDGPPIDAIEEAGRMYDQSQIPQTEVMRELAVMAAELVKNDDLIRKTEHLLEQLKAKRHQLVSKSLPDLFDQLEDGEVA